MNYKAQLINSRFFSIFVSTALLFLLFIPVYALASTASEPTAEVAVQSEQLDAAATDTAVTDGKGNAPDQTSAMAAAALAAGSSGGSADMPTAADSMKSLQISPAGNSGAAATSIPIVVPPGRLGMAPNVSLMS